MSLALPAAPKRERIEPIVVIDGIVDEIRLNPREASQASIIESEKGISVKLVFRGTRFFINLFDARSRSVEAFKNSELNSIAKVFSDTKANEGTLGRFGFTNYEYIALDDANSELSIIRPIHQEMILAQTPFDKCELRVICGVNGEALHTGTGICFCERRKK